MDGVKTMRSSTGPEETLKRLEAGIKAQGMTIMASVDHAALATEVGLSLRPTRVILFGNPRGGTPLMQANQTMGIDLPLKALIWQDATETTWLSYNEPAWLAGRHNITGVEKSVSAMESALEKIANHATRGADPV